MPEGGRSDWPGAGNDAATPADLDARGRGRRRAAARAAAGVRAEPPASRRGAQELHRDATTLATGLQERCRRIPAGAAGPPVAQGRQVADPTGTSIIWETAAPAALAPVATGRPPPHASPGPATVSTRDFTVTVAADDSYRPADLDEELLLIGALSLLAVAVAVVLGLLQARRLTRPLRGAGRGRRPARLRCRPAAGPPVRDAGAGPGGRGPGRLGAADQRPAVGRARLRRGRVASAADPADRAVHAPGGDDRGRRTTRMWCARRARRRWPRPSGWPRWSASCSAGPAAPLPARRRWPAWTTSSPSRWWSGSRPSGGSAGSSR